MSKLKLNKRGKDAQARMIQDIRRLTRKFAYWRWHRDDDDSPLVTNRVVMGINPRKIPIDNIEHELQSLSMQYQVVTISYCKTQFGDEYRAFGFAQTSDPLRLVETDIKPLISAALYDAEKEINRNHLYARGMVLLPYIRSTRDIVAAARALKTELGLKDEDFIQIEGILDQTPVYYEFEKEPNLDLDDRIRLLLEEEEKEA